MTTMLARYPVLAVCVAIGAVMALVELAAGLGPAHGAMSLAIVIGYGGVVTWLGGRNETAATLAGRPVDELWEHVNLEACTWAFGITAVFVLVAFLIAEATGADWGTWAALAAIMAASYVGSLVILRRRH